MSRAETDNITAGVLIGGHSVRMGRDKALLRLPGGLTWIEHVVDAARRSAATVVLVGEATTLPQPLGSLPVIRDTPGCHGPLAGLVALLDHATTTWVMLLSCDMPCLTPAVLADLAVAAREHDAVVFARNDRGGMHPCAALYHRHRVREAIRPLLDAEPSAGLHSVLKLLEHVHVLEPTAAQRRALTNINTPEELAKLLDARAQGG